MTDINTPFYLYVDGGTVGRNPSSQGICWAWILRDTNSRIILDEACGSISCEELGISKAGNNFAECIAAVMGLEARSDHMIKKGVTLISDSSIALGRISKSHKAAMVGMTQDWIDRLIAAAECGHIELLHVAGHPTPEELARGYAINRRGWKVPVSKYNVRCDEMCQEQAAMFAELEMMRLDAIDFRY